MQITEQTEELKTRREQAKTTKQSLEDQLTQLEDQSEQLQDGKDQVNDGTAPSPPGQSAAAAGHRHRADDERPGRAGRAPQSNRGRGRPGGRRRARSARRYSNHCARQQKPRANLATGLGPKPMNPRHSSHATAIPAEPGQRHHSPTRSAIGTPCSGKSSSCAAVVADPRRTQADSRQAKSRWTPANGSLKDAQDQLDAKRKDADSQFA